MKTVTIYNALGIWTSVYEQEKKKKYFKLTQYKVFQKQMYLKLK